MKEESCINLKTEIPFLPRKFRDAIKTLLPTLKKIVEEENGELGVILIGSCAKGCPRLSSDIDLVFVVPNNRRLDPKSSALYEARLFGELSPSDFPDIQIIPIHRETLADKSNHMSRGILEDGIYIGGTVS